MVAVPLQSKDLLNSLGSSAEVINTQVGQLREGSLDKLKKLRSAYTIPTASLTKYQAAADRTSDLTPFGFNPHPREALQTLASSVGTTYFQEKVAPHSTATDPYTALLDRFTKRGQILAMGIHKRDDLRSPVERIAVGRVLQDGRNDGSITIETNKKPQALVMAGKQIEEMASKVPPELLRQFLDLYQSQTSFGPFGRFESGMNSSALDGSDGSSEDGESDFSTPSTNTGNFDQSSGLDTEILDLKRMIDKKTHATDLYSQTLTAYNNAAKGIIEKLRA